MPDKHATGGESGGAAHTRRVALLRAALWLAAAGAAAGQSWAALSRPFDDRLADLQMYVGSTGALLDSGTLYDFAFPPTGAPFTYPPFAGMLLIALALPNVNVVMVGWTAATVAVVVLLAIMVSAAPGLHRQLPRALRVPALALLFFASGAVSSNLRFGQVSILIVLAVLVDCLRVVPARFVGVATGVAAAVKLTPLIFIPYFWFSGQRRAAVTATAVFAGCTGLAWAVLPADSIRFWGHEVFDVRAMGSIASGGNQSLNAALMRQHVPDQIRPALVATVGAVIVLIALVRGARAWRNRDPLLGAVIIGAAGIVFSPISWIHHQFWLVLAALLPVSRRRSRNLVWAAFVTAIVVLPVTSLGAALPGGLIFGNARLLLAVAVAAAIPFLALRGRGAETDQHEGSHSEVASVTSRAGPPSAADC